MLYAVLATALARWFGQPDTLGALMERAYLFTARERAVLARGIGQVRTIAELVGRAKTQANAAGIEFAKPDEAARKLNPARAFKLHPRKAMSYFKALSPARRIPLSKEWLDDHRREAFIMAEVTEATILKRVHKLIYDAIEEGDVTTRDFQVKLKDLGVTSKNPQYAEMVFRTNALDSYNKGYYDEVREDPDLGEYFPYWEYLAVEDDRLSEEHGENLRGENGPYYPASRSFDSVRGDRVFNCRCTFRWVDKFEAEELGLVESILPTEKAPRVERRGRKGTVAARSGGRAGKRAPRKTYSVSPGGMLIATKSSVPDRNFKKPWKKLTDRLLGIGGEEVLFDPADTHTNSVLVKGRQFKPGPMLKGIDYRASGCHTMAAQAYRKKPKFYRIITGFALSDDGMWRPHSWVAGGGKVFEPTERRTAYFGMRLTDKEAKAFAKGQLGRRRS